MGVKTGLKLRVSILSGEFNVVNYVDFLFSVLLIIFEMADVDQPS
jgi:hypothetical protein